MRALRSRLVTLGAIFFAFSAQAQLTQAVSTCPLTNATLTDLRVAAAKLSKTVVLSANCQAYQDTINQANEQLKSLTERISTLDGTKPIDTTNPDDVERQNRTDLAIKTITQLENINAVFKNDKCGAEAAGFLDYADGFTDIVTGVSPFLALYGGEAAAPWVLGTTLGGAAAKMVISFFKSKQVNMRDADQSAAFIKNSCLFYNFNQVKMSLTDLKMKQQPRIAVDLQAARDKLAALIAQAPSKPTTDDFVTQQTVEKDRERLLGIQAKLAADPFEACFYIGRYARLEVPLVERDWQLYLSRVSDASGDQSSERDYFLTQINQPLTEVPKDKAVCADLATRWLNKMLTITDAGLSALRKSNADNADVKPYLAWLEAKRAQEALVAALDAKVKLFAQITASGFNTEYSQIASAHKKIQDTLFESYKYLVFIKMRGLAEAWLQMKYEDAVQYLGEFQSRRSKVQARLQKIQETLGKEVTRQNVQDFVASLDKENRPENKVVYKNVLTDTCNELRKAWSYWYDGLAHAEAGRDYCVAFDNVIDQMDYPQVQSLCFGLRSRRSDLRTSSLRSLTVEIRSHRPEAEEIYTRMTTLGCQQAGDLTADLLKTKLE